MVRDIEGKVCCCKKWKLQEFRKILLPEKAYNHIHDTNRTINLPNNSGHPAFTCKSALPIL
jgi:hypothetical protein